MRAASSRRGSRFDQNPPTVRTTTATLKNTWAASIGATPRCQCRNESGPPGRNSTRNAVATTTVGSTNGTITSARKTRLPANSVPRDDVRGRKPDRERQRRGRDRLPQGEPHDMAEPAVAQGVAQRARAQRPAEDRAQRPREEDREKRQRDGDTRHVPDACPHRTTMSVHSLIQESRPSPIACGSIV